MLLASMWTAVRSMCPEGIPDGILIASPEDGVAWQLKFGVKVGVR